MALRTEAVLALRADVKGTTDVTKLGKSIDKAGDEARESAGDFSKLSTSTKAADKTLKGANRTVKAIGVSAGQSSAKVTQLKGGMATIGQTAVATSGRFALLGSASGGLAAALRGLLPLLGGIAFIQMGRSALNSADAFQKMALRTGASVELLEKFQIAADLSDTSIGTVGKALIKLSRSMYEASQGVATYADGFNALGVSVVDAEGKLKKNDAVLLEIAGKFEKMEDGPEKAALAMDILGKSGADLIPMLNLGSKAISELGGVMTQDFADRAATFNDQLTTMGQEFSEIAVQVATELLPAFEKVANLTVDMIKEFKKLPEPVQNTTLAIGALTVALALLAPALTLVGGLLGKLWALLGATKVWAAATAGATGFKVAAVGAAAAVGKAFAVAFAAIAALFAPPVWIALAVGAVTALVFAFREPLADLVRWFADRFKELGEILMLTMKTIGEMFGKFVVTPIRDGVASLRDWLSDAWQAIATGFDRYVVAPIRNAWDGLIDGLAGALNGFINGFKNAINGAIEQANRLIRTANKLPGVNVSQIPKLAQGAYVTGPTIAEIGEGGEPEYVIRASRMGSASRSFLAGARGPAVLNASGGGGSVPRPVINIRTGPVMQQGGQDYVSVQDFEAGISQAVDGVLRMLADPGTQRQLGMG